MTSLKMQTKFKNLVLYTELFFDSGIDLIEFEKEGPRQR